MCDYKQEQDCHWPSGLLCSWVCRAGWRSGGEMVSVWTLWESIYLRESSQSVPLSLYVIRWAYYHYMLQLMEPGDMINWRQTISWNMWTESLVCSPDIAGPERHDEVPEAQARRVRLGKQTHDYVRVQNHPGCANSALMKAQSTWLSPA